MSILLLFYSYSSSSILVFSNPSVVTANGDVYTIAYSGNSVSSVFPAGRYKLEVYGAQGGTYVSGTGGKGGYSRGVLSLSENTNLYFFVGEKGKYSTAHQVFTSHSFNGGGRGNSFKQISNIYSYGCSGGGATDIRVNGNTLNHRIIVAGGGGGGGIYFNQGNYDRIAKGGYGGGTSGNKGGDSGAGSVAPGGKGASQIAPGAGKYGYGSSSGGSKSGTFGHGGYETQNNYYGSGGGGGWYGGACGENYGAGGGGGSGFVLTASSYNSELSFPVSSFYLTDDYTSPDQNTNNGKIVVTILESYLPISSPYSKHSDIIILFLFGTVMICQIDF